MIILLFNFSDINTFPRGAKTSSYRPLRSLSNTLKNKGVWISNLENDAEGISCGFLKHHPASILDNDNIRYTKFSPVYSANFAPFKPKIDSLENRKVPVTAIATEFGK